MKKLFFATLAFVLFSFGAVSAQTTSAERLEELKELTIPKSTDYPKVNSLANVAKELSYETRQISPLLETVKARILDGDISPELVTETTVLGKRIDEQSENLGKIADKVADAASEVTKIKNPLKLKPATTSMNYSKEVISLVTQETAYQLSEITDLLSKLTGAQ